MSTQISLKRKTLLEPVILNYLIQINVTTRLFTLFTTILTVLKTLLIIKTMFKQNFIREVFS